MIPESLLNSKAYKLIMRLIKDLQYPIVYVAVGYPSKLAIQEFNSRIQEYAEENGYLYVDVYDIPNDERSDPHPTAEGHQYIADKILDVLKEQYVPQEEPVEPAEEPVVAFPVLNFFMQVMKTLHNVHSALHNILSPRTPSVLPFRQAMYGRSR